MRSDVELPTDVIAEIQGNRKITAIKKLRAHQGIGLKEAKDIVDAYIEEHPPDPTSKASDSEGGLGRIAVLILGVGVIYALYKYFA